MNDKLTFPFWYANLFDSPKNFTDAMDFWWSRISDSVPNDTQSLYKKMMNESKSFYFLSEQFSQFLHTISGLNQATDDWQKYLNEQFDNIKKLYTEPGDKINDSMQGFLNTWQLLPIDTLSRTFSSSSIMPGDFLQEFKTNEFKEVTDKFLSVPGIGYSRESQENIQQGIRLWNEYQRISNEYMHALSKVGLDALDSLRLRIIEMAEKGETLHSLREIYDLWVEENEKAYATYVYSEEYSDLYGQMTNALMAVKKHGRNFVDEMLGSLNMPTRKGINTMLKRQQEFKREHVSALQRIKQLEKEQKELKAAITRGGQVKAPTTKNKVKKKTRTKVNKKRSVKSADNKAVKKTVKKTAKKTSAVKKDKSSGKNTNNENMVIIKI